MAQQPNIELDPSDLPRRSLDTSSARAWAAGSKPGVITSPGQIPTGGTFGTPGPDTGWALKILRKLDPQTDPDLEAVLVALMAARAAALGRAPVPMDLYVAKLFCGLVDGVPEDLTERLGRWLAAVPHERSKGRAAVAEVDQDLLAEHPDRIRWALNRLV